MPTSSSDSVYSTGLIAGSVVDESLGQRCFYAGGRHGSVRGKIYRKLQEIEGNPLSAEQIAMYERFDRDGLSTDERLAILNERARKLAAR